MPFSTKTLRKVRKGIVGVKKMPDDSLADQSAELDKLDSLLSLFQEVAKRLELATSMLERAPTSELIDQLRKFYKDDAASIDTLERVSKDVTATTTQLLSGVKHLESMQVQVKRFQKMRADVRQKMVKRDEAWSTSKHYDRKANALKENVAESQNRKRSAAKTRDIEERLLRTEQKRRESQEVLDECIVAASTEVKAVVASQRSGVAQLLCDLCHYYSDAFRDERRTVERRDVIAALGEYPLPERHAQGFSLTSDAVARAQ
jgi:uncharacterized phage infection (PIP) family protein YhgE